MVCNESLSGLFTAALLAACSSNGAAPAAASGDMPAVEASRPVLQLDADAESVLVRFAESMIGFGASLFPPDCAWYLRLPQGMPDAPVLQRVRADGFPMADAAARPAPEDAARPKTALLEVLRLRARASGHYEVVARYVTGVEWTSGFPVMKAEYLHDEDGWRLVRFAFPAPE